MKDLNVSFSTSKGKSHPLGISIEDGNVNFSIFSEHAESITLCLFKPPIEAPIHEIELVDKTDNFWHISLKNVPGDLLYAYRVNGASDENESPLYLHDPYCKSVSGSNEWGSEEALYHPKGTFQSKKEFDRQ